MKHFATISWCSEDVLDAAKNLEIEMTKDDAEQFLDQEEESLRQCMIEAGARFIREHVSDFVEDLWK